MPLNTSLRIRQNSKSRASYLLQSEEELGALGNLALILNSFNGSVVWAALVPRALLDRTRGLAIRAIDDDVVVLQGLDPVGEVEVERRVSALDGVLGAGGHLGVPITIYLVVVPVYSFQKRKNSPLGLAVGRFQSGTGLVVAGD